MTEGSPPTNFSSPFQSAAGKKKNCVSVMRVVSAMAACQSFSLSLKFTTSFFMFLRPLRNKKKSFYVLISFFHIHDTHDRFSLPDRYALPPPRSDFLSLGTNLQPAPNLRHLSFSPVPSMMIGSEQCLHGWVQPPSN